MKIYTKTGDQGQTGLLGGARVPKNDVRVCAYGEIDELNAVLGLLPLHTRDEELLGWIERLQHDLFEVGTRLAQAPRTDAPAPDLGPVVARIEAMERQMDAWNETLEPLREFILPGGTTAAAVLHLARTVCRRAERACVALSHAQSLSGEILQYLNRLSDLLFVMARRANRLEGCPDIVWKREK